jgi:hypothetical protein
VQSALFGSDATAVSARGRRDWPIMTAWGQPVAVIRLDPQPVNAVLEWVEDLTALTTLHLYSAAGLVVPGRIVC